MRIVAYLDSSSVSMVVSAVVAGFAGVALVFKMGFRRLGAVFSAKRRAELRADKEATASDTTPAPGSN